MSLWNMCVGEDGEARWSYCLWPGGLGPHAGALELHQWRMFWLRSSAVMGLCT